MMDLDKNIPVLVQFSGGQSSAFLARMIQLHPAFNQHTIIYCFQNTGKEREETLQFVEECDRRWKLGVRWIEAKVDPEKGIGTSFTEVNYATANRNGEPFEAVISKYGIPSLKFPICTRELKVQPSHKFMRSLGYKKYYRALGIRADEQHRISKNASRDRIIYPLIELNVTKQFITDWWSRQDFDLNLQEHEGNCDLCWKKSKRKRLMVLRDRPQVADWWQDMENRYGDPLINRACFDQRDQLTIEQLVGMAQNVFVQESLDKTNQEFNPDLDMEWGCFCQAS